MAMKSSFGCASLQTGSLIIGWLGLLWEIFRISQVVYVYTSFTVAYDGPSDGAYQPKHYVHSNITMIVIYLILTVLVISSYISLIHGAYKERYGFLIPYLLVSITIIGYVMLAIAYIFITAMVYHYDETTDFLGILLAPFVCLAIFSYCFCVIWSYYKKLKFTAQKLKSPKEQLVLNL